MSGRTMKDSTRTRFARRTRAFPVIAAILSLSLTALIVVPLIITVSRVFLVDGRLNLDVFERVWNLPGLTEVLADTILIVGVSTLIAVIIGTGFAWLSERTDARMGWLSTVIPLVPLMVPPLAGALGWAFLAAPGPGYLNVIINKVTAVFGVEPGDTGLMNIYSRPGLIFVFVLYLVPHVYLTVAAALRNLDPSLEEASRTNGANWARTLVKVTLPAIRPAIAGGALLALVFAFALYSIPAIIGTPARIEVLAIRVVRLMTFDYPPDLGAAIVLGLLMVAFIGTAWLLERRFARAGRHATLGGRSSAGTVVRLGKAKPWARSIMIVYLAATTVLPFIALLIVSLQPFWTVNIDFSKLTFASYERLFESKTTLSAMRNSVQLGIIGATIGMIVAAVVAYFVHRNSANPISRLVDGASKLPGAVSHVVIALALVATFAGPPIGLHGSVVLLFLAYLIIYMPQASVTAGSALDQIGNHLSEASLMAGATQWRTFWRVVMPLMLPGLVAGWVFLFVLMVGDVTASVILASPRTPVVSYVMLDLYNNGSYPLLAALGTVMSLVCSAVVFLVLLTLGRKRRPSKRGSSRVQLPTSSS